MSNITKQKLKIAYVEICERHAQFDFFIHLTFRCDVKEEYARFARERFFRHMNECVFGRRYREQGKGLFIVYATALQKRGVPHIHLVVSCGEYYWGCLGVYLHSFQKFWDSYGISKMEIYDNSQGLAGVKYVVNHVYENGEIDFASPKKPIINTRGMRFKGSTYKRLKDLNYI